MKFNVRNISSKFGFQKNINEWSCSCGSSCEVHTLWVWGELRDLMVMNQQWGGAVHSAWGSPCPTAQHTDELRHWALVPQSSQSCRLWLSPHISPKVRCGVRPNSPRAAMSSQSTWKVIKRERALHHVLPKLGCSHPLPRCPACQ